MLKPVNREWEFILKPWVVVRSLNYTIRPDKGQEIQILFRK